MYIEELPPGPKGKFKQFHIWGGGGVEWRALRGEEGAPRRAEADSPPARPRV